MATDHLSGHTFGHYTLGDKAFEYQIDEEEPILFDYKNIAHATANGKNEIAFEFYQDEIQVGNKDDILTEIRFFVPNEEVDSESEEEEVIEGEAELVEGEDGKKEEKPKPDEEEEKIEPTVSTFVLIGDLI